jgi:ribosomal-protein-alanine N-acetyltransferase
MIAKGKRIYLRVMNGYNRNAFESETGDLFRTIKWLNDDEVTQWMQKPYPLTLVESVDYYGKMQNPNLYLAIVTNDGEHIGNVSVTDNSSNKYHSEISIVIGDKTKWGMGYATEAIMAISDYMFKRRDVHKLRAGACVDNMGCIKAFTKAGFIIEGTEKEAVYCDGEWRDIAIMGLLKKDWEALR